MSEKGNKYILTLQDDIAKFTLAFPIHNHEAETISRIFTTKFICIFGIPDSILTDQGTELTFELLIDVARLFKIKQIQKSAYHPQSNGALERTHQTLADYLKDFINKSQIDWDEYLDFFFFSYNTTVHSSTNYTPYELVFERKVFLPSSITKLPENYYTYDDYMTDLVHKLHQTREIARRNIIRLKEINKAQYDKKTERCNYKVGDKVYLKIEQYDKSKKLSPYYKGRYEIIDIISGLNVVIVQNRKKVIVHVDRLKIAHPQNQ